MKSTVYVKVTSINRSAITPERRVCVCVCAYSAYCAKCQGSGTKVPVIVRRIHLSDMFKMVYNIIIMHVHVHVISPLMPGRREVWKTMFSTRVIVY